jgi:hypothetical protein
MTKVASKTRCGGLMTALRISQVQHLSLRLFDGGDRNAVAWI